SLQPGQLSFVTLATIPFLPQPEALKACIDPFHAFPDPNPNDDCAELTLGNGTMTDLGLTSADLTFTPSGADIGEKVHITATVHNFSSTPGNAVELKLWTV